MYRRRVGRAGLASIVLFITHVVACSYDWNIGAGDALDAGPPQGSSAPAAGKLDKPPSAADSGTTDAASAVKPTPNAPSIDCGPNCTCKGDETCNFTCTKATCTMTCKEASKCQLTCPVGKSCKTVCRDRATCNLDCTGGGSSCDLKCEDKADCNAACSKVSVCSKDCDDQPCKIDCSGGGICVP